MDTEVQTLNLPLHRFARPYAMLDAFPSTRRPVPISEWHQLLGKLRSRARGVYSLPSRMRYVRVTATAFPPHL